MLKAVWKHVHSSVCTFVRSVIKLCSELSANLYINCRRRNRRWPKNRKQLIEPSQCLVRPCLGHHGKYTTLAVSDLLLVAVLHGFFLYIKCVNCTRGGGIGGSRKINVWQVDGIRSRPSRLGSHVCVHGCVYCGANDMVNVSPVSPCNRLEQVDWCTAF